MIGKIGSTLFVLVLLTIVSFPVAGLELGNAQIDKLDNGLTVILLEDRNLPVVSVQMLYRVGARNEVTGLTGLAHFLEHMAFRSSESFPDTGLVSSIYAVGGEWHGYTWTDQTTYFSTAPKQYLDLLLRIETDRMSRLDIAPEFIEAERGAVLAEMHMYENDPVSMLIDALMFTSFLAHPYRNNTIGFESDIRNIEHADVVDFYRQHYHPGNAVIAIVGDFDTVDVLSQVRTYFNDIEGRPPTPLPHTIEPEQSGVRRVSISGSAGIRRFMIGYRAPSARHPDYAAFLVLQELLGGSSGASFLQNDWGTAIDDGSVLAGAADGVTTWFPPSAQNYIFAIGGVLPTGATEQDVESEIESRIARLRTSRLASTAIDNAVAGVLDELVYDVETTEDAAHQLAFFEGLGALDVLLTLPQRLQRVTAKDMRRVAATWLQPERRTIAWYAPRKNDPATAPAPVIEPARIELPPAAPPDTVPLPPPVVQTLAGGVPVIVQESDLSASAYLQIVVPGSNLVGTNLSRDEPVRGYMSLNYRLRPDRLAATVSQASQEIAMSRYLPTQSQTVSDDPAMLLERTFEEFMPRSGLAGRVAPALIVASGDFDAEETFALFAEQFGDVRPPQAPRYEAIQFERGERIVSVGRPVAQERLGYIVAAPGPGESSFDAWQMLLYVLSHGYEGRLGVEAISKRGLAYYIDSQYRSDGRNGWITLAIGVDPGKMEPLKALLASELLRLKSSPPTAAEVEEAKAHLIGRARSAAQSNAELAATLAQQWLYFGEPVSAAALAQRLSAVTPAEVAAAADAFGSGVTIVVGR
ncbi:MAG: insulinase family protein [Gammaproteobacteria bacterium]|nr:insulinase family protein [Gammaproteobacteria bacterium]